MSNEWVLYCNIKEDRHVGVSMTEKGLPDPNTFGSHFNEMLVFLNDRSLQTKTETIKLNFNYLSLLENYVEYSVLLSPADHMEYQLRFSDI